MTGNSRRKTSPTLIVQPRDLQLLLELSMMRVADREQIKIVAGFTSTTRVNTRLLSLVNAGLLKRFFLGSGGGRKALYSLSIKGAQLVGVPQRGPRRRQDEMLIADFFIEHQLALNDVYCTLKYKPATVTGVNFHKWIAFHEPLFSGLSLIPDGYVEFSMASAIVGCFLEVDLGHESLSIWKDKSRNYLQLALSGEYQKQFGQERFRVLVLVNSERRLHSIRKTLAAITEKIFWFATLKSTHDTFFGTVWFRPASNQPKPLFD